MKIAVIGTHSTGKTTLCYDIAALLKRKSKSVSIVAEVSREAVKKGLPINQKTTLLAQGWILFTQIAKEIEAENEAEIIVCDRSVVDNYIYMLNKFGKQEFYETLILDWLVKSPYDLLIRIPPIYEIKDDNLRATELDFQMEIDEKLTEFLKEKNIEYIELNDEDKTFWLKFILKKLNL